MTRDAVDQVCLAYYCDLCGVRPGQWCVTRSGKPAYFLHASRFYEAIENGALPLPDDEPDQAV